MKVPPLRPLSSLDGFVLGHITYRDLYLNDLLTPSPHTKLPPGKGLPDPQAESSVPWKHHVHTFLVPCITLYGSLAHVRYLEMNGAETKKHINEWGKEA